MTITDVTCKILPLYRVRITYYPDPHNQHDDYYERHIIADSIEGLIQGIVDIEIDHEENLEEDGRRMLFDITDFLLMPCDIAKHGRSYHLFDIDEVDCGGWYGSSIDNIIYYYTYFSQEKHPEPGVRDCEKSKFAEPLPVMGTIAGYDTEFKNYLRCREEREATMDVIYKLARESEYRAGRWASKALENIELQEKAKKSISEWRDLENRQADFINLLNDIDENLNPKTTIAPPNYGKQNYGKKPDMWLNQRPDKMVNTIITPTSPRGTGGVASSTVDDTREIGDYDSIIGKIVKLS